MKFYENEEFKRQQKEWYAKLKDSGFKDIENILRDELVLAQYSTRFTFSPEVSHLKMLYFQAITECVNLESFDCEIEELVMFMLSDGKLIKEISEELKARGLKRSHRETIRYIIRKYEVKWGLRNYSPSQLSFHRGNHGR
jgi:hypothetical protein